MASQRIWVGVAVSVVGLTLPYLFAAWSFHRMVPHTVVLKPIAQACPEHAVRTRELEAVGFRPAVGPLLYNSRPRSQLSLLRHETEPVYAAVLRVRVLGLRKVHFSYLSPIVGEAGHFESTATPELEAVRAPAFVRFQVLPGATPTELMQAHLATMARLRADGLRFAVPAASELQREAIYSLALTGNYLRKNAYRLAAGLYAFAFSRRPRNPPVMPWSKTPATS